MSNLKILVAMVGILASAAALAKPAKPEPQAPGAPKLPQSWGEAVNGLQISISHDNEDEGPHKAMLFVVFFRNISNQEMSIRPGSIQRCGGQQGYTDAIKLNLVDAQGIPHRNLPFLGDGPPYAGSCFGNMVPLVVALAPNESYLLLLDLGKYFDLSDSKIYTERKFHAGTYSLQAELIGYTGPLNLWTGTAKSNTLQVRFDAEFAAPLDDYSK